MSMLRTSALRAFRGAPSTSQFLRFSSTWEPVKWREINFEELKPKTVSPPAGSYLIDLRGPEEIKHGMIPGAVNIPITKFPDSLTASPQEFKEQYGFEKPALDDEITFYCLKGKRSTLASDMARASGYTNVLNYKGSWIDWLENQAKPMA